MCRPTNSTTDHPPFWIGPVKRFGPFRLTTVTRQFRCLGPAIQPGAWTRCVFSSTRRPLAGSSCLIGGYVKERYSQVRCQTCKALLATRYRNLGPAGEGHSLPDNYSCGLRRVARISVLTGYASTSSVRTTKEHKSRPWFVPSWEFLILRVLVLPVFHPKVSCWLG